MTLDEAIKYYEEKAETEERNAKLHQRPDRDVKGSGKRYLSCLECAKEHRQLAEWLKELKKLRAEQKDVYMHGYDEGHDNGYDEGYEDAKELYS